MKVRATAFAPASVANVAVGFDLLGFSIDVAGDKVTVERTQSPEVTIQQISGLIQNLPVDPSKNTATAGLIQLVQDQELDFGFRVSIEKGIPFSSGMGGSAASAVAAIVAANALLAAPLTNQEMITYALIGEAQASGSFHADNIAPCFFGGLTLSRVTQDTNGVGRPRVEVIPLPLPSQVYCVLVHPHLSVETKTARGILKQEVALKTHIEQSASLAAFIAGCFRDDIDLLARSLRDVLIEPQRAHLIPGFQKVKEAALKNGALGCSISGAGPSVFAWVQGEERARSAQHAMCAAFQDAQLATSSWAVPLQSAGARLIG